MIQSYIIVTFNNKVDPNYLPLIAWFIRDTEKTMPIVMLCGVFKVL